MNTTIDIKNALNGLGVGVLFTFGFTGETVCGAEGYEAIGHLTSTGFGASAKPTGKRVIMFDVKVGKTWHVRTEPVIECKNGIAFQEGFNDTNNCIWSLTTFEVAYRPSESPFQNLRRELKRSRKDDVFFTNTPIRLPEWAPLHLRRALDRSLKEDVFTNTSEATSGPVVNNAAIATGLTGRYPPMDPSYAAFLWFAFTSPSEQRDGTNGMLLQIWDDGNILSARFRHAKWKPFPEPPQLVSSAVYKWVGKQWLPDGTVAGIETSDVPEPLGTAAQYEVSATTNFSGLMLPSKMTLTRYATEAAKDGKLRVVFTDVAVVTSVRLLSANEPLAAKLPGLTYVSDYRVSGGRPNGGQTRYFLNEGPLLSVTEVKQGGSGHPTNRLEFR